MQLKTCEAKGEQKWTGSALVTIGGDGAALIAVAAERGAVHITRARTAAAVVAARDLWVARSTVRVDARGRGIALIAVSASKTRGADAVTVLIAEAVATAVDEAVAILVASRLGIPVAGAPWKGVECDRGRRRRRSTERMGALVAIGASPRKRAVAGQVILRIVGVAGAVAVAEVRRTLAILSSPAGGALANTGPVRTSAVGIAAPIEEAVVRADDVAVRAIVGIGTTMP